MIAVHAGRLLEHTADVLSWTLSVSVTRRKDDRYTIGDLWPSVAKVLKKTAVKEATEEVDRYLHLRNMLGAHPNPWADAASLTEVQRFGGAVLELHKAVSCSKCRRWVEASPERGRWVCRCGETSLETS